MYHRLSPILFQRQSHDQHAFTPGVRIEDALVSAEIVIEQSLEFHMPLWLLSMDLRKAFDRIDHDALLQALRDHGIDEAYLALIDLFYSDQRGVVQGSRSFHIQREVK